MSDIRFIGAVNGGKGGNWVARIDNSRTVFDFMVLRARRRHLVALNWATPHVTVFSLHPPPLRPKMTPKSLPENDRPLLNRFQVNFLGNVQTNWLHKSNTYRLLKPPPRILQITNVCWFSGILIKTSKCNPGQICIKFAFSLKRQFRRETLATDSSINIHCSEMHWVNIGFLSKAKVSSTANDLGTFNSNRECSMAGDTSYRFDVVGCHSNDRITHERCQNESSAQDVPIVELNAQLFHGNRPWKRIHVHDTANFQFGNDILGKWCWLIRRLLMRFSLPLFVNWWEMRIINAQFKASQCRLHWLMLASSVFPTFFVRQHWNSFSFLVLFRVVVVAAR